MQRRRVWRAGRDLGAARQPAPSGPHQLLIAACDALTIRHAAESY